MAAVERQQWPVDLRRVVVNQFATEFARRMLLHAAQATHPDDRDRLFKHAANTQNAARLQALLRVAPSFVTISRKDLDTDKYLLNCVNGTIDLSTGTPATRCSHVGALLLRSDRNSAGRLKQESSWLVLHLERLREC
jgi:hypothetical protein